MAIPASTFLKELLSSFLDFFSRCFLLDICHFASCVLMSGPLWAPALAMDAGGVYFSAMRTSAAVGVSPNHFLNTASELA